MNYKLFGSFLVIAGCGGTGFTIAAAYRLEQKRLSELLGIFQYMYWELQYHLTPLPQLCRQAGMDASGPLKAVFLSLARELQWHSSPDVYSCMRTSIRSCHELTPRLRKMLLNLGKNLGRFDLDGQLQGLKELQMVCRSELRDLGKNQEQRMRSYRTLGLCAGTALSILLF